VKGRLRVKRVERKGQRKVKCEVKVMSSKKEENAGIASGTRSAGKVGKIKAEGRQSKLTTEGKEGGK